MSVKIKVSYENAQELQDILNQLGTMVKSWKRAEKKGEYYRAYIILK